MPDITIALSDDDYERLCEKAGRTMGRPEAEAQVILRTVLHFYDAVGGEQKWREEDERRGERNG